MAARPSLIRRVAASVASAFRPRMQALSPVSESNRGWSIIFDSRSGAWQADETPINTDKVLANWTVFACLSLIAADIGKMRLKLVELGEDGIWRETRAAAFSPVLKKPNRYQTRQQFFEAWIISKLGPAGNTYVLKVRDNRQIVTGLHVLNPWLVTPLIAPDGSVWYRLGQDYLAELTEEMEAVPASEIIHDRANCLFHPLVGVSPIYANALAALQGRSMQSNAEQFFRNKSMPGGVITVPGEVTDAMLEKMKAEWNSRYTGDNAGKTAVLGWGMKYEPFGENARDSQMTEQLSLSGKVICATYHVPPFKIGIEALPGGQKVEDMNRIYYADCLQTLIEAIEVLLDEGLGLEVSGKKYGTEFEVDDLLRMDNSSLITALGEAVGAAIMSPDEARYKLNLPSVEGGDSPYLQQQNYSLAALAKRDAAEDPFGTAKPEPAPAQPQAPEGDTDQTDDAEEDIAALAKTLPSLVRAAA